MWIVWSWPGLAYFRLDRLVCVPPQIHSGLSIEQPQHAYSLLGSLVALVSVVVIDGRACWSSSSKTPRVTRHLLPLLQHHALLTVCPRIFLLPLSFGIPWYLWGTFRCVTWEYRIAEFLLEVLPHFSLQRDGVETRWHPMVSKKTSRKTKQWACHKVMHDPFWLSPALLCNHTSFGCRLYFWVSKC
jgi:hypothetical protein